MNINDREEGSWLEGRMRWAERTGCRHSTGRVLPGGMKGSTESVLADIIHLEGWVLESGEAARAWIAGSVSAGNVKFPGIRYSRRQDSIGCYEPVDWPITANSHKLWAEAKAK